MDICERLESSVEEEIFMAMWNMLWHSCGMTFSINVIVAVLLS